MPKCFPLASFLLYVVYLGWDDHSHPTPPHDDPVTDDDEGGGRGEKNEMTIQMLDSYHNRLLNRTTFPLPGNGTRIHNPKLEVLHVPTF